MNLLVQPDDGAAPLIAAIDGAQVMIDLYVFRLSHDGVKTALKEAVERGVSVRALVAHVNSKGKDSLRKLEQKLLDIGCSVARSDDDLLRYHGKLMIVDQRTLFVLGYNFTKRDMDESRSLGVCTDREDLVMEASTLFECDLARRTYAPKHDGFVVSPSNSRHSLLSLIEGAEARLLIYDSRVADARMQRAIEKQARRGVEVRVIGKVERDLDEVRVLESRAERLHVRAIVQDDERVYIGSGGLRRAELERRREVGVILDDSKVVHDVTAVFESDWAEEVEALDGNEREAAVA